MKRSDSLDQLRANMEPFDVFVIGGGATGLGVAVDAATRGYRVGLAERADFASGTSSRSTKLVHGGVRYLRQGNISLVREALQERGRLAANAPHLVHNRDFVIPAYAWWEAPYYGLGLGLYERLAGRLSFGRSRQLTRAETLQLIPTIEPANLRGGVLYHDGQFDDARLAMSLAQTAEHFDAVVINHCPCVGLMKAGGRICGVQLRDAETGAEFEVRATVVVNATGVFVDEVRSLDDAGAESLVVTSQGIHVVLPREFLPGDTALMVPRTSDGRVLFAVPWHDRVVVGTTDTPVPAPSAEPRALAAEREFVMTHAGHYLAKRPRDTDVLSVFAGLRPLVKSGSARRTAALSRDHTVVVDPSGLITVTGGKWTTYRRMAEDVVNLAARMAGLEERPCETANLRLHGARLRGTGEGHLAGYGSDAEWIMQLVKSKPGLGELLHPRLPYLKGEVLWHVRCEMARTVEDVLARRTRALFLDARASAEAAPDVARILAAELGRNAHWAERQAEDYQRLCRGYCYMDPESTESGGPGREVVARGDARPVAGLRR